MKKKDNSQYMRNLLASFDLVVKNMETSDLVAAFMIMFDEYIDHRGLPDANEFLEVIWEKWRTMLYNAASDLMMSREENLDQRVKEYESRQIEDTRNARKSASISENVCVVGEKRKMTKKQIMNEMMQDIIADLEEQKKKKDK